MSQDTIQRFQKARFYRAFFLYLTLSITLNACATLKSRINTAEDIIQTANLHTHTFQTPTFPLFSAHNTLQTQENKITIIIEGDGYAWVNRRTLSGNPTPKNPIGLKITATTATPATYLARPCQYVSSPNCTPEIWSYDRFNKDVINAYNHALNQIKKQYATNKFEIIGFSGGAYIALNLAANRNDISKVTTIAGALDPQSWTQFHGISPLRIKHTPNELITSSRTTSFEHICSHDDEIMPCKLTQQFIKRTKNLNLTNHHIIKFSNTGHTELWKKIPQTTLAPP